MTAGAVAAEAATSKIRTSSLLTLASGQFLMTLDSSVMNVVDRDRRQGRRHDGHRHPDRDHLLHARDGRADDHGRQDRWDHRPQARASRSAASSTARARSRPRSPRTSPCSSSAGRVLEGIGAALIMPAIVALVASNFGRQRATTRLRARRRRGRDRGRRRAAHRRLVHDVPLVAARVRRRGRDRAS